jgi:2-methylcitrate dehydratase PrpD
MTQPPQPATDGLTRALGRFIASARIDPGDAALRHTLHAAMADCMASALAGSTDPVGRMAAMRLAPGPSTVWGQGRQADARDAAFANACAAHAHSIDDTHESMRGHPSAPILPAVFALAQEVDASPQVLLRAFAVGVEVAGKLGRAINDGHSRVGWHTTGTLGTIGAAAGCAHILGLDAQRATHALGIAASMASGLRVNFGSPTKALHAGLAAQNGVQAARLAQAGFSANPEALEGYEGFLQLFSEQGGYALGRALDHLGESLEVQSPGLVFKLYPTCSLMHALIDMVLDLRGQHAPWADAVTLRCGISPRLEAARRQDWPRNGLDAKFHVEYCVATAWLLGTQGIADFTDAAIARPALRAMAARVEVFVDPATPPGNGDHASLQVLRAGQPLASQTQAKANGHPSRPLSDAQRQSKFQQLAEPALGQPATRQLWEALHAPDTPPLPALGRLLAGSAPEPIPVLERKTACH